MRYNLIVHSTRLLAILVTILLSAMSLASKPIDALVFLDESGSMYGNGRSILPSDANFLRLTAIQCLARKLRPGDRISVLPFGTDALVDSQIRLQDPFSSEINYAALAQCAKVDGAKQLSTNYDAALKMAQEILGPNDSTRSRLILMLSDGEPNEKPDDVGSLTVDILELLHESGAKFFALGFGDASQSTLLASLTQAGEGSYFQVQDPRKIPFAFASMFRLAAGREVRTPAERSSFNIGPNAHELRAISSSKSTEPIFKLVSPKGQIITPLTDQRITPGEANEVRWARIENPEPGEWKVQGDPRSIDIAYESSLKAIITAPSNHETIRSDDTVDLHIDADGAEANDVIGGRATLQFSNGKQFVKDLKFESSHARESITFEDQSLGPASIHVQIWRSFMGTVEEGVPADIELEVIKAKPGIPTVHVEWPSQTDLTIGPGDHVRIPVRLISTKEAQGKVITFTSDHGWSVLSGASTRVDSRNQALTLEWIGPFSGNRGDFETYLSASSSDPALVLQFVRAHVNIHATNWIDRVLFLLKALIPVIVLILMIGFQIGIGAWRWKLTCRLRSGALNSISLDFGEGNAVRWIDTKSYRIRTFGTNKQSAELLVQPEPLGEMLSATIPNRNIRPTQITFRAPALSSVLGDVKNGEVTIGSGRPVQLILAASSGRKLTCTAEYRYDSGLARRIDRLTSIMKVMTVLIAFTLVWTTYKGLHDWDSKTYHHDSDAIVKVRTP